MSNQSTSQNSSGVSLSQVPPIRSFELDAQSIGKIKNSVNQFRGSVSLPMDFLTLPGHDGLDVKVSALYSSTVRQSLATWNVESPTGALGLGWQMPFDMILRDKGGNGSESSDRFYFLSNGSAIPMVRDGVDPQGRWLFQLRSYQFWTVTYDPKTEVWDMVHENGVTYRYGAEEDSRNTVQWGVKWGNWLGSSSLRVGQDRYATAWNLSSITSPWGQQITYAYENDDQKVGSRDGLEFTQASYLATIVDTYGRTIRFTYGEKYGARNPSPRGIVEYQAAHSSQPEPNAYQDRYETRFLDRIEVENEAGEALSSFQFTYDFINYTPTSDPNYPLLWKRVLLSVFQENPQGEALPALNFSYTDRGDVNPGALKTVTYPEGGVAQYTYKKNLFQSPKKVTVSNPYTDGTPRVWHGDDYVVFTFQNSTSGALNVLVYSWNGRWVKVDLSHSAMAAANADPESLSVIAQADYLSIAYRNQSTNQDELFLYRKRPTEFGEWDLAGSNPQKIPLKSSDSPLSQFVGGDDFVIAFNADYVQQAFLGFSYDWRTGQWTSPPLLPSSADAQAATGVVLSAINNFYVATFYFEDQRQAKMQFFYRDSEGAWNSQPSFNNSNLEVQSSEGRLLMIVSLQPGYLVLTYVTGTNASTIEYSLRFLQWDERFFVLNSSAPKVVSLETEVIDDKPLFEVFQTVAAGNFVANNSANLRNVGGDLSNGSSVNWLQDDFAIDPSATAFQFASGSDVAVMSEFTPNGRINKILTFNPNQPSQAGWSSPSILPQNVGSPTVAGNVMTLDRYIFFRDPSGQWNRLATELNTLGDPDSVQNTGRYIAYQDNDTGSAKSYFVAMKNGQASSPVPLPGSAVKVAVSEGQSGPGTQLASPTALVTYPSSEVFDRANTLELYNLEEPNLSDFTEDFPVAYLEIADAYNPETSFSQSYFYGNSDQNQATYDAATGIAQYPMVTVVPAVKVNAANPPAQQPEGRNQFFYSNGLSPQASLGYPVGWIYNYQEILNGMLLGQRVYDSENLLVSSQTNYWKTYTQNQKSGEQLLGAYVRLERTQTSQDGVGQNSTTQFDERYGVELWQEQTYYDSEGEAKVLRTEKKYAWQVSEYQEAFLAQHRFDAVVEQTKSVSSSSGARQFIESQVTTYQSWRQGLPSGPPKKDAALAPVGTYQWTEPGTSPPSFNYAEPDTNSKWILISAITGRMTPEGLVTEQKDGRGVVTSFQYDKSHRYLVTQFPNGSLRGDEVDYYGFEDYETNRKWNFGPGAVIVPNGIHEVLDAHTGNRSLRLAPRSTGDSGISATFQPAASGQSFIFSAWVKKPTDYNNALGSARFVFKVEGGESVSVPFPESQGSWVYLSHLLEIPQGKSVVIQGENPNTDQFVLLDDLRFTPQSCLLQSLVYDTHLFRPRAELGANGECSRKVYGPFQKPFLESDVADSSSTVHDEYFSRQIQGGTFRPDDPNAERTIVASEGGILTTFNRGDEWTEAWQSQPADAWVVQDGRLTQSFDGEARLGLKNQLPGPYSLAVQFQSLETVVSPMGIQMGSAATLQWNPTTLRWQCLDKNQDPLCPPVSQTLFEIPTEPYAAELNRGTISQGLIDLFLHAGYPLPSESSVSPFPTGGWTLEAPKNSFRYDLRESGDSIEVHRVAGPWILTVTETEVIFWVAGQSIFSLAGSAITASDTPELFFPNRIAIDAIATVQKPQVAVVFKDSRGNSRQSQTLGEQHVVVSQTLMDRLGRSAVRTKAAAVEASATLSLLEYAPSFASLDWSTGIMTGVVAEAYPLDDGFPYSRDIYEPSPLGRVIERGLPGADFTLGSHSAHLRYSRNDGSLGLPKNQYFKTEFINPNGDCLYEISNSLQQVIYKVSILSLEGGGSQELKNFTLFDDAGNPREQRSPNYYDPPEGSSPADWVTRRTFDFAGRTLVLQSGTDGLNRSIYSPFGDLRFAQDPQGAEDDTYNYFKYDPLGRPLQKGYLVGAWDQASLETYAKDDPSWPPTPSTWRQRNFWDGDATSMHCLGRIASAEAQNGTTGEADTLEGLAYDLFGNVLQKSLQSLDFDAGQSFSTDYLYDSLGNIRRITYPQTNEEERPEVFYRYNGLNQITDIAEVSDFSARIATYLYFPDGRPRLETLNPDSAHAMSRSYAFNSPLWFKNAESKNSSDQLLFGESLTYTEGGYENAGYYDGTIASCRITDQSNRSEEDIFRYSYSSVGQINNAQNKAEPEGDLGLNPPVSYDANGNFRAMARGGSPRTYHYLAGSQRVSEVVNADTFAVEASYEYNANGDTSKLVQTASPFAAAHRLTLTYDPGTHLTVSIDDQENNLRLEFQYGSQGERVLKTTVQPAGGGAEKKLYVRGTNAYPLVELTEEAGAKNRIYIYGPGGLLMMGEGGKRYTIVKDHLGSIRRVLDEAAQVVASYDYLTFGALAATVEPSVGFMPYLYTGQEYDREVGLYNYRARFYSPRLGRFIAVDHARQFFSPYIYASNNPVLYTDPSGMFSLKSFFSAIGGVLIGAVEILIGVAIDALAGVLEVVTGGLGTAASVALASAAGAFYGAGVSSITYSVFNFNDFSWKDYGIQMGIGAVAGAISFGFGALGAAVAESATGVQAAIQAGQQVSNWSKAGNLLIKGAFAATGSAVSGAVSTTLNDVAAGVTPGADVAESLLWGVVSGSANTAIPAMSYQKGWGELGKRVLTNVAKKEVIGIAINTSKNAVHGQSLDTGLVKTVVSGAAWGSLGAMQVKSASKQWTKDELTWDIDLSGVSLA